MTERTMGGRQQILDSSVHYSKKSLKNVLSVILTAIFRFLARSSLARHDIEFQQHLPLRNIIFIWNFPPFLYMQKCNKTQGGEARCVPLEAGRTSETSNPWPPETMNARTAKTSSREWAEGPCVHPANPETSRRFEDYASTF